MPGETSEALFYGLAAQLREQYSPDAVKGTDGGGWRAPRAQPDAAPPLRTPRSAPLLLEKNCCPPGLFLRHTPLLDTDTELPPIPPFWLC